MLGNKIRKFKLSPQRIVKSNEMKAMNAEDSDIKNIVGIQQMLVLFSHSMSLFCNSLVASLFYFLLRYKIFKNPQALLMSPNSVLCIEISKNFLHWFITFEGKKHFLILHGFWSLRLFWTGVTQHATCFPNKLHSDTFRHFHYFNSGNN